MAMWSITWVEETSYTAIGSAATISHLYAMLIANIARYAIRSIHIYDIATGLELAPDRGFVPLATITK